MRFLGKQLCYWRLCQLAFILYVVFSLLSSVWPKTKLLEETLQRRKLVHLSITPTESLQATTDGVACRHSVVGRGESECKAQTANQLLPTSPMTQEHSIDQWIKTESTESITDWANRMVVIGSLLFLNTEAWENRDLAILSDHVTY